MVDSTLKECYTYDTVWKDQLKTVGNESIFYDAQGNPTSYLGHALTWTQGNRLKTYDNTSYAYNHQGLRTKKTVNGVAHTYLWEGTRLISEAYNGNTMVTLYGSDGSVCGILYNGARYYFNKNLQGDVISILNMAGNTLAKYTYDAWGKILSVTDAQGTPIEDDDDTNIALINPYRYRGYYFDSESNFYYLQTRYYDPETGRFISPDNISYLNPKKFIGLNLYAYCNNDSVMYKQSAVSFGGSITTSSILVGDSMGSTISTSAAKQIAKKLLSSKSSGFNLFGYELRKSAGWDTSPDIATGFFGRIGFSSYVTHTQGQSGMLYAFAGSTSDVMNWFGTTYYAGVGINLFDIIGAEVQLEAVGIGAQVSIGNFSIGANINLIGGTSITFGWDTDLGNGMTRTKGFTISVNTGCLVAAICWIYKFVTTGDPSPVPGLQPA